MNNDNTNDIKKFPSACDVVVVGAGHAGIEAAIACAKTGCKTILVTQSIDAIGRLSCNPSIGGISKGNIVREIDALGGVMAKLIDQTMIQFRMLNKSRGPAVQAPRSQADKILYAALARKLVENQPNLSLLQDTAVDILIEETAKEKRVAALQTQRGRIIPTKAVILTTGTFLEGTIYIGEFAADWGRLGEEAAKGLGPNLARLGFTMGRLKTGTPSRVLRSSLDFSQMQVQPGDSEIIPFSFDTEKVDRPSVPCHLIYTNEKTHQIIRENITRSPLYSGKIHGVGARYCPSLEDKVVRFAQRDRHQVFVEPEGLDTQEMYINGTSSSLPEDVQDAFVRTLPGFADVVITRPGYAVEYDFIDPTQLYPSLEAKHLRGLFAAGQINGTSGYEEAAGQGLVAGINASAYVKNPDYQPLVLSRSEAYIGVLIDDLVTLGTKEPYRMFTARAEYRLKLRHDTADIRLCEKGWKAGLKTDEQYKRVQEKVETRKTIIAWLKTQPQAAAFIYAQNNRQDERQESDIDELEAQNIPETAESTPLLQNPGYPEKEWQIALIDYKYEHYIEKQDKKIEKLHRMEQTHIPADFDYSTILGLSTESRQKLEKIRPLTLGQASRISGLRSTDVMLLMVALR